MVQTFVDLSHHNAGVDLAVYARAGHDRVVLKATEGSGFTDPTFAARWRAAGAVGLRRGAYHFARTATSGAVQADHLLAVVAAAGGLARGDWLVLDLEDDAGLGRAAACTAEFCRRLADRGHPTGVIYTRTSYAGPAGLTPDDVPAGWRRLWLADYNPGHADATMPLPAGWSASQVAARQYTDAGSAPGVTGNVDVSRVIHDWLAAPAPDPHQEEVEMIIVSAPERPWLAYYPASGAARTIGPGEQGPLERVHTASGDPARSVQLTVEEYDRLIAHLDRGVHGRIPGLAEIAGQIATLTKAVMQAGGSEPVALTQAAQAGAEPALHQDQAAGPEAPA